jgi:Sigma 54 modulation protein / S30EA ribosomal protein
MKTNIRTTFRHMHSFDELNEAIQRETRKLQEIHPPITSCRVTIDRPHHNGGNKERFRIRVVVSVPGRQLVSSSEARQGYFDLLAAVTSAFHSARDSVGSYLRRRNAARPALPTETSSALWEYPLDLNHSMNYSTFP